MRKFFVCFVLTLTSCTGFCQEEVVLKSPDNGDVLFLAEQMPSFPGGDSLMMRFINFNIRFPDYERMHNIMGKVYVTFVVDTDGTVGNIKVIKGIQRGPGLENEAIQVIRKMPKWNPGMQNGKKVKVQFNLPIKFTLKAPKDLTMEDLRTDSRIAKLRSAYQALNEAQETKDNEKYKIAIGKLSEAIDESGDVDLFLYRAICSFSMGNTENGCNDLKLMYKMGYAFDVDPLFQKYCK